MDLPKARGAFLGLGLALAGYAILLPLWLEIRAPYGKAVSTAATQVALPLLGLDGTVETRLERSLVTVYTFPYVRTGGWGQVRQRLLNVPDLPLAVGAAFGLWFLPWWKRLLVAGAASASLFALHVALAAATAWRLSAILGDLGADPATLDANLHCAAEQVGAYRDIAPVVVLLVVGVMGYGYARVGGQEIGGSLDADHAGDGNPRP